MPIERILMTADTVGGVWTYAVELTQALQQQGVEVLLATMGGPPPSRPANLQIEASNFKLEWMPDPWDDLDRAADWLLDLDDRFKPDLIHLNHYTHGHLPWSAPSLVVGHSCVLSWWEAVHGRPAPPEWDRYAARVRLGLQSATAVAAPTRAMLDELERHYGFLPESRVISNGRSPRSFAPADKEPYILAAGRLWDEAKNISSLLCIAEYLPWPVRLAGPLGNAPISRPNVEHLGVLSSEAISSEMSHASIFVHPARYEPFGLSILEAALSGCALVLGDIASLRENWSGAAMFVDPNDIESLQRAVDLLIHDASLRARLASVARSRALAFTPERMAQAYLDVLEPVCV